MRSEKSAERLKISPQFHTSPRPINSARMEVVGWSPSEKVHEFDTLLPHVEDGESECVLDRSSVRLPLIHNRLFPTACTPVLRPSHLLQPPPLASSLLPLTSVVSKIPGMSPAPGMHLSSIAATTPQNTSKMAARSVLATLRRSLYPKGLERLGGTKRPKPYGTTRP